MHSMPIRTMNFELDADAIRHDSERFYFEYGLSMTLPHLEPYLIRAMRKAIDNISDEALKQDAKQFCGQEAQHYKQHAKLNDIIRGLAPELSGLKDIEDEMAADYKRFLATKSLKFNMAYSEGFEAATSSLALTYVKLQPPAAEGLTEFQRLFAWHLTEELEHKTVTFDVYDHLYGAYFYRLFVGIYAQVHFFSYVIRFAKLVIKHDPQPQKGAMTFGQKTVLWSLVVGKVLKTYLPWYNPSKVEVPKEHLNRSKLFTEEAVSIREA